MKRILIYILTLWFVLTQVFPPFNLIMPFKGAIQIAIYVASLVVLYPSLLVRPTILWTLLYGFITYIFFLFGHAYFATINDVVVPLLHMLSGLLISEYIIRYDKNYSLAKMIVVAVVIANVLMAIISIPQLILFPSLMRNAYELEGDALELNSWLMAYSNVHGIPLIIAPMVFICRKYFHINKWMFVISAICIVALVGVVFFSNAALALIITIIALSLSLYFRIEKFKKKIIVRASILVVFAFIFIQPPVLVPVLRAIQSTMNPNSLNYEKIDEIETAIVYGEKEGDLGGRSELYESSSKLFFESPLLGTSTPERIGRHSWIMDHLAIFGIFFIIPIILIFRSWIKSNYRCLSDSKVVFVYSLICWGLMLYFKAEFGGGTWLYGFAFIPAFCLYSDRISNIIRKKQ